MFSTSLYTRVLAAFSELCRFGACLFLIITIPLSAGLLAEDQQPNDCDVTVYSDGKRRDLPGGSDCRQKAAEHGAFVGAPIPISSPAIGSGIALIGGYIRRLRARDTTSPPSVIGGGALFTDNGSRGAVAASELYFAENRYHVLAGYAWFDLNYHFYGTGNAAGNAGRQFALNQTANGVFAQATRRLFWNVFVGPRLLFGTSKLAAQHLGEQHPELPPLGVGFNLRSIGVKVERETAENRFYPANGTSTQFSADFFSGGLGSTFTYQTYNLTFNAYQNLSKNQVLGYNTYVCATGGRAPFFGECIFGTKNELRGYPAGRYIDRDMIAAQIEYRLSLPKRFGFVAFAGVGEVGPSFGEFNRRDLLPSFGFGPRFQVSKQYHVNLRVDFAQGKNDRTFSMGLGESF